MNYNNISICCPHDDVSQPKISDQDFMAMVSESITTDGPLLSVYDEDAECIYYENDIVPFSAIVPCVNDAVCYHYYDGRDEAYMEGTPADYECDYSHYDLTEGHDKYHCLYYFPTKPEIARRVGSVGSWGNFLVKNNLIIASWNAYENCGDPMVGLTFEEEVAFHFDWCSKACYFKAFWNVLYPGTTPASYSDVLPAAAPILRRMDAAINIKKVIARKERRRARKAKQVVRKKQAQAAVRLDRENKIERASPEFLEGYNGKNETKAERVYTEGLSDFFGQVTHVFMRDWSLSDFDEWLVRIKEVAGPIIDHLYDLYEQCKSLVTKAFSNKHVVRAFAYICGILIFPNHKAWVTGAYMFTYIWDHGTVLRDILERLFEYVKFNPNFCSQPLDSSAFEEPDYMFIDRKEEVKTEGKWAEALSYASTSARTYYDSELLQCMRDLIVNAFALDVLGPKSLGPIKAALNMHAGDFKKSKKLTPIDLAISSFKTLSVLVQYFELFMEGSTLTSLFMSGNPMQKFLEDSEKILNYRTRLYEGLPVEGWMDKKEYIMKIQELIKQGNELISRSSINSELKPDIKKMLLRLDLEWATRYVEMKVRNRTPPIGIILWGASSIGKSKLLKVFPALWHSIRHPDSPFDESMIFNRSKTSDYWEGYNPLSQPYVFYSELANESVQIAKKEPNKQLLEMNSLIDALLFNCDMAFNDKGKIFAMPEMVIGDTNNPDLHVKETAYFPAAQFRRYLFIHASVLDDFRAVDIYGNKTTSIDSAKSIASPGDVRDRYEFTIVSYQAKDKTPIKQEIFKGTFFPMLSFLKAMFIEHIDRNNALKAHDNMDFLKDILPYEAKRVNNIAKTKVSAEEQKIYDIAGLSAERVQKMCLDEYKVTTEGLSDKPLVAYATISAYSKIGWYDLKRWFRMRKRESIAYYRDCRNTCNNILGSFMMYYFVSYLTKQYPLLASLRNPLVFMVTFFIAIVSKSWFVVFLALVFMLICYLLTSVCRSAIKEKEQNSNFVMELCTSNMDRFMSVKPLDTTSYLTPMTKSIILTISGIVAALCVYRACQKKVPEEVKEESEEGDLLFTFEGKKYYFSEEEQKTYEFGKPVQFKDVVVDYEEEAKTESAINPTMAEMKAFFDLEAQNALNGTNNQVRLRVEKTGEQKDWGFNVLQVQPNPAFFKGKPNELDYILRQNIRLIRVTSGDYKNIMFIYGVIGEYALLPYHAVKGLDNFRMEIFKSGMWTIDPSDGVKTLDMTSKMVVPIGSDLCMIWLSGMSFRNILVHVIPEILGHSYVDAWRNGAPIRAYYKESQEVIDHRLGTYNIDNVYLYSCEHEAGHCGLPIYAKTDARGSSLIGLHIGGSINTNGYAHALCLKDLNVAIDVLQGQLGMFRVYSQGDLPFCQALPHPKSVFKYEVVNHINYYGKEAESKVNINQSSKLQQHPWVTEVDEFLEQEFGWRDFEKFAPPVMKPFVNAKGQYISPYNLFIRKLDTDTPSPNLDIVEKIVEQLVNRIVSIYHSKGVYKLSPLTMQDAVNGVDDDMYSKRINTSTSAAHGLRGKKADHLVVVSEDPLIREPTEELMRMIFSSRVKYLKGDMAHPLFGVKLKDEARPQAKVDLGKTRPFCMDQLFALINARQYLSPAYTGFVENSEMCCSAIGFDMHRAAHKMMHVLYHHVCPNGEMSFETFFEEYACIMEGDYENYDMANPLFIARAACEVIERLLTRMGYSDYAMKIVRGILSDSLNPYLYMNGDVFCRPGYQPSGKYATAEDNSLRGILMLMYAWYSVPELEHLDFFDNVRPYIYGDDMIAAVKPAVGHLFNNVTYRDLCKKHFNMVYTSASKSGELVEFLAPCEISFLKRTFEVHFTGNMVAKLSKSSIHKTLEWFLPSGAVPEDLQVCQALQQMSRELFFHSISIEQYNRIIAFLGRILKDRYGGEYHFESFDDAFNSLGFQ